MSRDCLRIACVGDIMCGDRFHMLGWGAAWCIDKHGQAFVSAQMRAVFAGHDLCLGNVECVLSDVGRREHSVRSLSMRGRAATAQYLRGWGLTAAHVANNHILEHGLEAARDTAANLRRAGITVVGGGPDDSFEPGVTASRISVKGTGVSIVGACFHNGQYAFRPGSLDQVLAVVGREQQAGLLVVVSVHWGDEFVDRPNLWQRDAARRLIAGGATLVIGHHAHVFQGVVSVSHGLVAYSMGNFIFDSISDLTRWSAILSIEMRAGQIIGLHSLPILRGLDFRPELATGEERRAVETEIVRRCGLAAEQIDDPAGYELRYRAEVAAMELEERKGLWRYVAQNMNRYRLIYWPQIFARPLRRRLRLW